MHKVVIQYTVDITASKETLVCVFYFSVQYNVLYILILYVIINPTHETVITIMHYNVICNYFLFIKCLNLVRVVMDAKT